MTPKRKDVQAVRVRGGEGAVLSAERDLGQDRRAAARKMQKPLDTVESMKHFVTPVDFEVRLFVTEEKLGGKPIAMTWDERGRLWVAITQDYPNEMQPEGQGRDRIVICEDTDGDGVCDKVTIFADKLSIPTSLLICNGGVIVHQAPHTLFLKDTKGDGKADVRQVLFTGWGTSDTHAGPSNLRYGFDNWIYGMVGYAGFNGDGRRREARVPPGPLPLQDRTRAERCQQAQSHQVGVPAQHQQQLLGRRLQRRRDCSSARPPTAARASSCRSRTAITKRFAGLIAGRAAEHRRRQSHSSRSPTRFARSIGTAASRRRRVHEIYTARTYPQGILEPRRVRLRADRPPDGDDGSRNRTAPVSKPATAGTCSPATTNGAAPIDAQVGPDGHIWVIDWYNFIVQHNPTPAGFKTGKGGAYETELRDKTHGRIYRVVYTKAKPEKPFTLKDATPEQLVAALKHPTMTWRLHAQRLLVERGKTDVVEALMKLAYDISVDEIGFNPGALHALRTLSGLKREPDAGGVMACDLAKHPSAAVRRTVIEFSGSPMPIEWKNRDPQVRLASILSMTMPSNEYDSDIISTELSQILNRDDIYSDANCRDALTMAAAAYPQFITHALQSKLGPTALRIVEIAMSNAAREKRLAFFFDENASFSANSSKQNPQL